MVLGCSLLQVFDSFFWIPASMGVIRSLKQNADKIHFSKKQLKTSKISFYYVGLKFKPFSDGCFYPRPTHPYHFETILISWTVPLI